MLSGHPCTEISHPDFFLLTRLFGLAVFLHSSPFHSCRLPPSCWRKAISGWLLWITLDGCNGCYFRFHPSNSVIHPGPFVDPAYLAGPLEYHPMGVWNSREWCTKLIRTPSWWGGEFSTTWNLSTTAHFTQDDHFFQSSRTSAQCNLSGYSW